MQKKVSTYLKQWKMLSLETKVCVGFSGGADSTALLLLLWELGYSVLAVHINHGIRGEEARRDQNFCENFCLERNIPIKVFEKDVPKIALERGISTEEAGRFVRYEIFEKLLKEGEVDRVALAHHKNDQAETMLFHLMRGTGLRGLRGMEPVRFPYIRPFLSVTREEIEAWLQKKGIVWVEDGSNYELEYSRNQIRHQVLAPMEQIRKGSIERMADTAVRLLELEDFLKQELEKQKGNCVKKEGGQIFILLTKFNKLHPILQKALVQECLEELLGGGKDLEAIHIEQVCALALGRSGSRLSLPQGFYAIRRYEELLLKHGYGVEKSKEAVYCEPVGEYHYMGEIFRFSLENWNKKEEIPVNCYTKWFDYDKMEQGVVLRNRLPGDYLETVKGSHKKLKDYLIDCKIPKEERDALILLADGSHIIWVVGMRISEHYKVTEQTRKVLKVQRIEDGGI